LSRACSGKETVQSKIRTRQKKKKKTAWDWVNESKVRRPAHKAKGPGLEKDTKKSQAILRYSPMHGAAKPRPCVHDTGGNSKAFVEGCKQKKGNENEPNQNKRGHNRIPVPFRKNWGRPLDLTSIKKGIAPRKGRGFDGEPRRIAHQKKEDFRYPRRKGAGFFCERLEEGVGKLTTDVWARRGGGGERGNLEKKMSEGPKGEEGGKDPRSKGKGGTTEKANNEKA